MNNKVAIYCPTKQDWLKMLEVIKPFGIIPEQYPSSDCVNCENSLWLHCDRLWYENGGYEIISLEDYIKQEGILATSNTNPKQALGLSSIPMNLLSPLACAYGSLGKLNGKLKYGGSNFIGTEVIMSIYMDAIRRHLDGIMAGEEFDPADGVPHFGAMLANIDIILCARAGGTLIDDRPLLKGYREEMSKLKPIVDSLYELHKDKNPKHYYLKDYK